MILIGTSGFSYKDWKGPFYPKGLPEREMLAFYSERFRTVELNFSYYAIPSAATSRRLVERSAGRVEFVVKAHRSMTHTREAGEADYEAFLRGVAPLREAGLLGAFLVQFPHAFRPTRQNAAYLLEVCGRLAPVPVVVEFRHAGWVAAETFDFLRRHGLGFCCVDEPRLKGLLPPVAEATGPIGYFRFHGRNAEKWWRHDEAYERYDYLYVAEELAEWVPKILKVEASTEKVYAFFNNHYAGQAVTNSRMLEELLAEAPSEDHTNCE